MIDAGEGAKLGSALVTEMNLHGGDVAIEDTHLVDHLAAPLVPMLLILVPDLALLCGKLFL